MYVRLHVRKYNEQIERKKTMKQIKNKIKRKMNTKKKEQKQLYSMDVIQPGLETPIDLPIIVIRSLPR